MSWSIKIVGSNAAVKAAIKGNLNLPQGLIDAVIQIADAPNLNGGLMVESTGHIDSTYGGYVNSFSVTQCILAPEPASAAVSATPSTP